MANCPKTADEIRNQLCGIHYYPGTTRYCANITACNKHFERWLKTDPEVQRIHEEWRKNNEKE